MKRILDYTYYFLKESFYPINTSYNYEWVKTTTLWNYREFDRADRQFKVDELKDILSNEGFNQPLILQYSHKYKTSYLIEGNHRLLAALQLGIKYVPVRVTIDGVEKKDAHSVIGYYSSEDRIDVHLPSEIGIPDCLDKNGRPIESENRNIEQEEVDIDYDSVLSQYPDISKFEKVEDGCYTIWIETDWWNIHHFMKSEMFDNLDSAYNNNSESFFKEYNSNNSNDFVDFLDGNYFTKDMMEYLQLDINSNYDAISDYFWEEFVNTPYYPKYVSEIKRVIWERYTKENGNTLEYGDFETPYDGIIEWWYDKPNLSKLFNTKGMIIKNELLECYDSDMFEYKTFFDVLKNAYNKEIGYEWKVDNIRHKITPNMLIFNNIFN